MPISTSDCVVIAFDLACNNANHILAARQTHGTPLGGELVVSINRLLEARAFNPDEVKLLAGAFEAALQDLNLVDRADPATELVAKRILELALRGERDPVRLREAAVKGT
jgi:hypothetical protein